MKKCLSCGKENSDKASFCNACGMRFGEAVFVPQSVVAPEKKSKNVPCLIKSSIILAVAVLITILSFMPTLSIELGSEYDGAVFDVYPSDNVFYLVDSFEKLENCDSETLNNIEDTLSSLEKEHNYYEKNGKDYKELQAVSVEIYKWQLRLNFKGENFSSGKTLFVAALFSIAELLASVAFLIFAVLDFLGSIEIIKFKNQKITMCAFGTMLFTLAMVFPATLATRYIFEGGSLHASKILSIVILSLTVFGVITGKAIIKKSISAKKVVLSGISLALLAFVFAFAFNPIAYISIDKYYLYGYEEDEDETENIETPIYASELEKNHISSDDEKIIAFKEMTRSEKSKYLKNCLGGYTPAQVEAGCADYAISQLLVYIMNSTILNSAISTAVSIVPIVIILAVAVIGVAVGVGQMSLLFDTRMFKLSLIMKILAVLLSVLAIAGALCFASIFNYSIGHYATDMCKIKLGAGIIAMAVCILAMAVIPLGKGKNKEKAN